MNTRLFSLLHTLAQIQVSPSDLGLQQNDPTKATTVPIVLKLVFGLAGSIAFLMITIGGFRFVISRGDPAGTAKARNTVIYALVGLVLVLLSYAIVSFVVGRLK